MIKKYERKIAILLIALLVFPMNIFSSIGTVFAEDGEEENYTTVHETDFSNEDHNVDTNAGGEGSVTTVEIDGEPYDAFFMEDRPDGNWNSPTLSYTDAGIEYGETYRITAKFYTDSEEFDGGDYQLTTNDHEDPDIDENVSIELDEIVEIEFNGVIEIESNNEIRFQTSGDAADELQYYLLSIKIEVLVDGDDEDPGEIPEDERLAAFTDFEDGTTQGWEPRGDNEEDEILTPTTDDAKNGEYSLLVENRNSSSDAAKIEFLDDMHPGNEYTFSLWVKLAEGEEDTELQLSAAETVGGETEYYPPVIEPEVITSDEWVLLEGTYNLPSNIEELFFYVEEPHDPDQTTGVSYYIDDFRAEVFIADYPVQTDLTPLHEIYADYFLIGNAVENRHFNGRTGELLTHHHNLVTAENVMKPDSFYNETVDDNLVVELEYTDSSQTAFLNNAVANNLKVHGHVLVWHSQSPGLLWGTDTGETDGDGNRIYEPTATREQALANMYEHIDKVMRSADEVAGDKIISWDVVNEALATDDWSNPEDWQSKLRDLNNTHQAGWFETIGEDFIYKAFVKAREVADDLGRTDMVLYYNDYNDHVQGKARTMYHMVKDINERYADENPDDDRLLIGGVGMQAHYTTTVNIQNVRDSLERFIELGVEVGVTELDVGASDTTTITETEELEQAYFYAQLFDLYREHAEHISRVTLWGLSDGNSWRSENNPLLFDRNLQAKEAYHAIVDPEKYLDENEDPGLITARQGNAGYGTPVMDGVIDEVWEFAPVLPINRFQGAHNGATGEAKVLWDSENVYVLVDVNDTGLDKSGSEAHEQDSVEVFIDEQNTKSASYGEGHFQYRVNFDNEQSFNPSPVEGFESRTFVNGTNYTVEMKIPFLTTTLDVGDVIGFDVQINDASNGSRNTVAIWSDVNSGMGWEDPSVFGELTLLDEDPDVPEEPEDVNTIEEGEEAEVEPDQKVVVESGDKEVSIKTPSDLPTGTKVEVNFVDPDEIDDPQSESGEALEVAGDIVNVELTYPEGEEDFEGDFELVLGFNPDYQSVSAFYLNEDGVWERRTGGVIDREDNVVRITVQGFSTYGVFEVEVEDVIEDLEEVISNLTDRLEELEGLDENVEELEEMIGQLRADVEALETSEEMLLDVIADMLERIEALEAQVAELEEDLGDGGTPPSDDGDDTSDDEDDSDDTDGDTDEDSDDDSEEGTDEEDEDGDALPSTATSIYNFLLIGALILIAGAGLALYTYKRRRA